MTQTVQEFMDNHTFDTPNNSGIYAIHQTKDECIALFHYVSSSSDVRCNWNEDIRNGTPYKSFEALCSAPIAEVVKVTSDWIRLIVYI